MKKFHIWFSTKKMFARTFLAICAIAFAAILAANSVIFFWFRKKSEEDYKDLALLSVSNADLVFGQYIQQTAELAKNWYYTAQGQECRMERTRQTAKYMGFVNDMRQMVSTLPYVQSVSILNYRGEEMLSFGAGISYTQDLAKPLFEELKSRTHLGVSFVWTVKNRYEDQPDVPLITVYFQEAEPGEPHYCGTVAVHLDARMFAKSIFSVVDQEDFQIYILNGNGAAAAGSISSCFEENWSKKEFMKDIRAGNQGSFYETEDDGSVNEIMALPSSMQGYYIAARAAAEETAGATGYILNVLLVSGLLASVFILISTLLVCTRLYRPFYGILSDFRQSAGEAETARGVDEIQFLHNFYNELTGHISELNNQSEKETMIKALLTGNQDQTVWEYLLKNEIIRPGGGKPGFYAILISVYRNDAYQDANMGEYDALRNMAGTIYAAKLGELGQCRSFELGLRRILLLLTESEGRSITKDALQLYLKQAQRMVSEIKGVISYTIVSRRMGEAEDFSSRQYRYMEERILSRKFLQKDEPVFCEDAEPKEFPQEILNQMEDAVKAREWTAYQKSVEAFLEYCADCPYPVFLTWNAQASWELSSIGRTLHINMEESQTEKSGIYQKISEQKSREELLLWYGEIYQRLAAALTRTDSVTSEALMERATDYIRKNYDNADLNVNMLADVLGISAAYFGKLFKEFAGCSMVEYLKRVRMEKAYQELLFGSEKSVAQVARETGFGNPAYFTTLFKKQYGVSPSKLREANRLEEEHKEKRL